MALDTKFIITFTLLSLLFLVLFLSPINQTHNILSSSSLPLPSIFRRLQDDADQPKIKENDITLARIEEQLAKARGKIRKAIVEKSFASSQINGSFIHHKTVYKNPFAFFQSHTEMMKTFKIWTYKEGDVPLMHNGPMIFVYSIEGDFIEEMERKGNPMVAKHPDEAHAFFIPHNNGADHFFVSCHDWGPFVSKGNPKLFENFIRVLCNANSSEGFVPSRDVSMSGIHGFVRKRLFEHWGNNEDNDIQVYNYLPKGENHTEWLTKIIIKSHYVIPYSDVLDWSQFSVQVPVDDIPNLKTILEEIPFSSSLFPAYSFCLFSHSLHRLRRSFLHHNRRRPNIHCTNHRHPNLGCYQYRRPRLPLPTTKRRRSYLNSGIFTHLRLCCCWSCYRSCCRNCGISAGKF
ncbi:unnamed protein product [Lactuca saligna]|uniref:Exostosin GT47 domain-containing protein n=1 Tax=Lactuca saligna TaxID=75948 RepID=A0AA35UJN7_LACSI|nr:unnamed protein product [Lactuca saligna]